MKSLLLLPLILGLGMALIAPSARAEGEARKPSPELQKLAPWTGKWRIEETVSASPFGPAGKGSYRCVEKFAHGGYVVESQGKGRGPVAPLSWTEILYYDTAAAAFRSFYCDSDGVAATSNMELTGSSLKGTWTSEAGGKRYTFRTVSTIAADGKSYRYEWDYTEDGVTWKPLLRGVAKRVGSVR
ncbi:MAG: DUF1579 family protein [Verrucomicrobiales bacterium]|nr:DUF1579 family protein [Verrucomicrobiales bacterium]